MTDKPATVAPSTTDIRPDADPCQCHRSRAYITPTHRGHCCFVPATQTCHPAEVAAWTEANQ